MIIARLIGGLGNQMFQYAISRRTACVNRTKLKLDITEYENQKEITPRKYMLNIFNISEDFAKTNEINELKRITPFLSSFIPYYRRTHINEKYFHFDPNILTLSDNVYLEGHWVSEKYFIDIENIIRKDFTFKKRPNIINKKTIDRIQKTNSVSIHVRRGDYVTDNKTNKFHGICNLNYYKKAVAYLAGRITKPCFFIFSDDLEWAKTNLRFKYSSVYIENNMDKDYEDMRLMSNCKHNIIANSTFSWWGAWLNNHKNKIVIAPNKWFADTSINTNDIIPKQWLKL